MSGTEQVSFTLDGQTVRADRGTTILEAARGVGVKIPHYCYHPGLSVVGNCRMCLVEIEKIPKLQPSCATPVTEGMIVRSETPEALRNRQSVLEFLLINHPLDCPVCDQAGECELQNYYMDHGAYNSRFNENKVKRKKAFPIGPTVILDQERCILCTRCVRFTREVSKSFELSVHDRGHLSEIDIFPGMQLENPYSGNVVDICPVGALTDRDFRFQCRVWFLQQTASVCPGCSRGCNIEIHTNAQFNPRYHEKRVQRLKPRLNPDVNGYWMCDAGRYAYHSIDASERLLKPRLRQDGSWKEIEWNEAMAKAATALKDAIEKHGAESVAVLASPQMTNEELHRARELFAGTLGVSNLDYRVPVLEKAFSDAFLINEDKNPNSRGAQTLGLAGPGGEQILRSCKEGRIHFLYLFHHDLTRGFDEKFVAEALGNVEFVIFHGSWHQATAALADMQLPAAVYAEKDGTYTNSQGRVQRINPALQPLGESRPDLEILSLLAENLSMPRPSAQAEEVFAEIADQVSPFRGMSYATIGDKGLQISD